MNQQNLKHPLDERQIQLSDIYWQRKPGVERKVIQLVNRCYVEVRPLPANIGVDDRLVTEWGTVCRVIAMTSKSLVIAITNGDEVLIPKSGRDRCFTYYQVVAQDAHRLNEK